MNGLRAPRETLGETLAAVAEQDERLMVLDADLGRSTRLTVFEERFPKRYIQVGVAEQNAVGIASGLVYAGYRPVFVSFTMFTIGLCWTQLRQAAYAGLPIKIIGTHPGYDIGPDGGTHQMFEDLALARVIPELDVFCPSDVVETRAALLTALASPRLTYVRVGRHPVPVIHREPLDFPIGRAEIVLDKGRDYVLLADGSMVFTALEVAEQLAAEGQRVSVVNVRTIKPLDVELISELGQQARLIVTIENHSVYGGLGGAVAEVLASAASHSALLRIGTLDRFGESATTEQLRQANRLDKSGVLEQIRNRLL
ncbi:MAG: transketolase family protein [Caldilineales bacterium]|nr:transketolase family protein [Caldilineales bacterium]